MATVGQLMIMVTGNTAPLTAALAASRAEMSAFAGSTAASGAAAGGSFRGVGIAALAMGAGVAVATGASVMAAKDFQEQMAIINTIAQQTPAELDRTGQAIRAMAIETGEPVESLTSAFYDLLSAGVAEADAMAVLGLSTTLAIGGLATTKETVNLLTGAMNAYELTVGETRVATDQFALAIEHGKVTAAEISGTFADIAPMAQTAGIGIDEIAASYARLTARNVPAAVGMTQMNRAILELMKPNADLIALQEKTGTVFADVAREQGLVVALQQMRDAAKENDVPFQDLFGRVEGLKFALATTGPAFKKYMDELASMQLAAPAPIDREDIHRGRAGGTEADAGTAAEQAEARMGTFERQTAILGESLKDLAITIGTPLLEPLTKLATAIGDIVRDIGAWARENPGLATNLLLVAGAVSAVVAGVIFLSPIVGALATAFGLITSPITIIVVALTAIAASFGLLGEGPKKFVDDLAKAFSDLLPKTGPVRDVFNILSGIVGVLATIFKEVATVVGGVLIVAFDAVKLVIDSLATVVGTVLEGLKGIITFAGEAAAAVGNIPGGVADEAARLAGPNRAQTGTDILGYATGGIVPGPIGAPQLAVVHGGETITPPGQSPGMPSGTGAGQTTLVTHTHVHLDGREIAEVIERTLLDNAMNYSSGLVGSPVTS